jgi:channel protein (hemolysin III family)
MERAEYFRYSFLGFADPVSSITHLIGAAVALILGIRLCIRFNGPILYRFGLITFVSGTVFMLSMSGVYHLLDHNGSGRYVLQHLDYASIWLMIAGTFTPVHLLLFQGWKRWGILLIIWAIAINGVVFMTVFFDDFPEWLALVFYLGMGWVGLYSGILIFREHGLDFVRLLGYGGIAYSVGAILDFIESPTIIPGVIETHEIFHFAIIIGIVCHWRFIEQAIQLSAVVDAEATESV